MKICPNCKYERSIKDNLLFPDYECPSCGIIFEKDKARQELAELEKQREEERKAKQKKIKKEEERKRKKEQERLKREEQERQEKEEAERLRKLEAERIRREEEDRKQKEEQERQEKAEEEKKQKDLEEKKRQEQEAKILLAQRQEKITKLAHENPDRIVSLTETEKSYHLFDMCPFGMAQTGKGLSIVGFGDAKNKWQHARCMQQYCRLWTWKNDEKGEVYAQGCSLQFLGLSKEEIKRNFTIKNTQILEDENPLPDESSTPDSKE